MIIYYIRKPSRNKNGWLTQSRVSEYNNVVITTVGSLINMAASSTGASWVSWSTVTWLEGVEHHQLPPATNTEVISSACAKWTLALALFQEISEAACLPMNFRRWLKNFTREWDGNNYLSNQWISQCFDIQRWYGDDEGCLGYTEHVSAVDFSVWNE